MANRDRTTSKSETAFEAVQSLFLLAVLFAQHKVDEKFSGGGAKVSTHMDEAVALAILQKLPREEPAVAESGESQPETRLSLHAWATKLMGEMQPDQRRAFVLVLFDYYRLHTTKGRLSDPPTKKEGKVEVVDKDAAEVTQFEDKGIAACTQLFAELRLDNPTTAQARQHLEKIRTAPLSFLDTIVYGPARKLYEAMTSWTLEEWNEYIKRFPKNSEELDQLLDSMDKTTASLRAKTTTHRANRRKRQGRRFGWFSPISIIFAIVVLLVALIATRQINYQPSKLLTEGQEFSSTTDPYLPSVVPDPAVNHSRYSNLSWPLKAAIWVGLLTVAVAIILILQRPKRIETITPESKEEYNGRS